MIEPKDNKTCTDRFQDCCKNWTLNQGFCYNVRKKVNNFKVM